jgi:hypothetical protein
MTWITPTEACNRLGISREMLQKKLSALADEGQARRDGRRWKLRLEGLEVTYDDITRGRSDSPRIAKRERESVQQQLQVAPPPSVVDEGDERSQLNDQLQAIYDDDSMPRTEAERQIAVLKRRMLELDVAEREGQLVEVEAIQKAIFERGRRVRDLLMGIPVRIAADLAAEADPAAVGILLEREMVQALEGLINAAIS